MQLSSSRLEYLIGIPTRYAASHHAERRANRTRTEPVLVILRLQCRVSGVPRAVLHSHPQSLYGYHHRLLHGPCNGNVTHPGHNGRPPHHHCSRRHHHYRCTCIDRISRTIASPNNIIILHLTVAVITIIILMFIIIITTTTTTTTISRDLKIQGRDGSENFA